MWGVLWESRDLIPRQVSGAERAVGGGEGGGLRRRVSVSLTGSLTHPPPVPLDPDTFTTTAAIVSEAILLKTIQSSESVLTLFWGDLTPSPEKKTWIRRVFWVKPSEAVE